MAATPKSGTFIFRGMQSGKAYPIDIYVSDVAGASLRFDNGNGAGAASDTFITFDELVALEDYAQVTGTADTTKMRITANGKPTAYILRYAIHLTTLNNRPKLNITIRPGTRFSAIQLA